MSRTVQIIGIPIDLGQSHRGVDMGPGALRYAGLAARLNAIGYEIDDIGNLPVLVRDALAAEQQLNYLPTIKAICEAIYEAGQMAVKNGNIPIFLGGDHSISIGSVGGITDQQPAGLIWIDAHGDFNTPKTSPTGNIHGMSLAVLLGDGYPELVNIGRRGAKLEPRDVVLIGIRDIDPKEGQRLKASGVTIFTMRDIDERGINAVTREALEKLDHRQRVHVSLDIDSLDPMEAPGVGTTAPGGLTYREAQLTMEIIADSKHLSSLDIVEINPILDQRNHTAKIAVELAASLFGKSII